MTTTKNQIVSINGKAGEYTGYSSITKTHNFSMYDGSVIRLSDQDAVKAVPDLVKKDSKPV